MSHGLQHRETWGLSSQVDPRMTEKLTRKNYRNFTNDKGESKHQSYKLSSNVMQQMPLDISEFELSHFAQFPLP